MHVPVPDLTLLKVLYSSEKVGSDSGGRVLGFFHLKLTGVLSYLEKGETQFQSTFQSRLPSLKARGFRDQILAARTPCDRVLS